MYPINLSTRIKLLVRKKQRHKKIVTNQINFWLCFEHHLCQSLFDKYIGPPNDLVNYYAWAISLMFFIIWRTRN